MAVQTFPPKSADDFAALHWAVYRINDARARHTAVQTGLRTATDVEITAGLANGDRVILQPDESIHDGSRVQTPPE